LSAFLWATSLADSIIMSPVKSIWD